jgi:predicted AAA+ superfamily ATPase
MEREAEKSLEEWYQDPQRKPLVLRGSRQVGKSTLVRQAAAAMKVPLWEVNLERHAALDAIFRTMDVPLILREIALATRQPGVAQTPGLLFLDEIQAAPHALAALRYFHEERPDLPVIAAGSLLEFTLAQAKFSMPVGRIEYRWLGPMSFREFLQAAGEEDLVGALDGFGSEESFSTSAHERLLLRLRDYLWVGGMPEAVLRFVSDRDTRYAADVHHSILETYRDDFAKYSSGTALERVRRVFELIPANLGSKVRLNRFHPDWRAAEIRQALELLTRAGICMQVYHSDGGGVPLIAGEDRSVSKLFHLDVGLAGSALGMTLIPLEEFRAGRFLAEGPLAEQFVAQHLFYAAPRGQRPSLHYWLRDGKSQNSEVDFLLQSRARVMPVEVKSGASGSLRSLHQFMLRHPGGRALRFDLNPPSSQQIETVVMSPEGKRGSRYELLNRPLYMATMKGLGVNASE